jgi:uncharacterized protein YdaU (DUF1376 family)
MTSPRPWMPLYVADYLADTGHLTTVEHGAYFLLIMEYWQKGRLPESELAASLITRLSLYRWRVISKTVLAMFPVGADGRRRHKRIDREIERVQEISLKRRVYGSIGGRRSRRKNNVERFVAKHDPPRKY